MNRSTQTSIVIIVHKHADIDSLASALALHELLCSNSNERHHLANNGCIIIVPEDISVAGKEFLKKTGLEKTVSIVIAKGEEIKQMINNTSRSIKILVDTASLTHLGSLASIVSEMGIDLLIDHHAFNELTRLAEDSIYDKDFSSSSEIVALLISSIGANLKKDTYCILQAGIITDTSRFTRAGPLTFEAMDFLTQNCPYKKAQKLSHYQKKNRSDIIAVLKALQRLQVHVDKYIVAGTFIGSNEAQVLSLLINLGADACFALSIQRDHIRVSYRISDKAPERFAQSFHISIKSALKELEGPQGHERAGVYIWRKKASKRELPSIVKMIIEEISKFEDKGDLG